MTDTVLAPGVRERLGRLGSADVVVAFVDGPEDDAFDDAIRAAQVGLAQHFPALRPAIVNVIAARADVSPVAATTLPADAVERAMLTRPTNDALRVDLAVADPSSGSGLRAVLEAAVALDVRAVVVLGGDLRAALPEWIELLGAPIVRDRFDLVTPFGDRHRYDDVVGILMAAPATRALYGLRVAQPAGGTAGIGRALAERLLQAPWHDGPVAADLWLTTAAVAGGARVGQAWLGPTASDPRRRDGNLDPVVRTATHTLLGLAVDHAASWIGVRGSADVGTYGFERRGDAAPIRIDPVRWLGRFETGATTHREAWTAILSPSTLNAVLGLAVTAAGVGLSARDWLNLDRGADIARLDTSTLAGAMATFHFPDEVWARVVVDAIVAAGRGDTPLDEIADALVPIFFGRAAAFVVETRQAGRAEVAASVERQAIAFERLKPDLVARWSSGEAGGRRGESADAMAATDAPTESSVASRA